MTDNELLLYDRIEVIKQTINKYGEDKFYISFSGGKDSTVLSKLIDLALPNNKIPRVYVNTGIEYFDIVKFVEEQAQQDNRIVIIKPTKPIIETLERVGYPFKSKNHSHLLKTYRSVGINGIGIQHYLNETKGLFRCPNILRYQFTPEFKIKCSNLCCNELKKKPFNQYVKNSGRTISITGMLAEEGGSRKKLKDHCIITDKSGKIKKFHPLIKVSKQWEDWFIQEYNIKLCKLYYPPYNFVRTGCKGCPFALHLQKDLDIMEKLLPAEKKQCEFIWEPIYKEYRRLGYRLRKETKMLFNLFNYQRPIHYIKTVNDIEVYELLDNRNYLFVKVVDTTATTLEIDCGVVDKFGLNTIIDRVGEQFSEIVRANKLWKQK